MRGSSLRSFSEITDVLAHRLILHYERNLRRKCHVFDDLEVLNEDVPSRLVRQRPDGVGNAQLDRAHEGIGRYSLVGDFSLLVHTAMAHFLLVLHAAVLLQLFDGSIIVEAHFLRGGRWCREF